MRDFAENPREHTGGEHAENGADDRDSRLGCEAADQIHRDQRCQNHHDDGSQDGRPAAVQRRQKEPNHADKGKQQTDDGVQSALAADD